MALRIDVKAGERFVLNDTTMHLTKSAGLVIETKATFIRTRNLIRESDVNTPAERVHFLCQQIYLSESRFAALYPLFKQACIDLLAATPGFAPSLLKIDGMLLQGEFYRAMKLARELVEFQDDPLHVYF
jgi:flagellar biosynthesis repressor protein FlbT